MTTLWVLLHVAAQRDYELHSLDFSTDFLQGSLHEEIWLRRPLGFTGSFPASTKWSLRRPIYGLRQAPREWHDKLRTTLAALGFAPSAADPSLFLRTDTSLPPFYVLVYVNDLMFATADTEALTLVKSELQKRHTCTDLGELQITRDRARRTITHGAPGPSALRLPVLLATTHSSVYRPLALSSTFGQVRRAEWSVPRARGLPHAGEDFQAVAAAVQANPMAVLLDCGCSHRLMGTKAVFMNMAPSDGVKHVRGFNVALQPVEGRGTVTMQGEAGKRVLIPDVLYVQGVQANLLFAGQLKESGVRLQGHGDEMLLDAAIEEVLGRARYTGRVLCTNLRPCSTRSQLTEVVALWTIASATKSTPDRLHARLTHVSVDTIKSSAKHEVATGLDITSSTEADPPCVLCVGGKLVRHTFPAKGLDAEEALAVVHIDLCGQFRVAAKDGSLYFLLLKDRHTRIVWVMPVAKKSDVLREFQKWLVLVDGRQRSHRRVREDNAAAHGRAAPLVAPRSMTSCLGVQLLGAVDDAAGDDSVPAADREEARPHAGAGVGLHGAIHGLGGARPDRQQGGHVGRGDLLRDAVAGARRPPERLSFYACLPPAAFTTVYDEVDNDLLYDDAEEDEELPELDPDVHADPEHRWDIATMTVKEAMAS
ncbi:unnamed protein product [Closterium sp. NIES-54]